MIHNIEVAQLLAKTYVKYRLNVDEFIVLNAYCMHNGYYGEPNFEEMGKMTGKDKSEILRI